MDTIFALASAQGRAGVSVVRVSGPLAKYCAKVLAKVDVYPRKATLCQLSKLDGSWIDQALLVSFDKPHSFTGEDVVEFHVHGSPAVVQDLLSELAHMDGCRLAEAGEFTRRALENDKLDLSQAEGLGELISAETVAQKRQAERLFRGGLSDVVEGWRDKLLTALSLLEASIDFSDEEIPEGLSDQALDVVSALMDELERESIGTETAKRLSEGFEVAIVGPPNVGKSTLINRLAGRDTSITSAMAGTTRDVIEVRLDVAGLPVTFLDTAGLRVTEDEIEKIGVDRAIKRANSADLRVFLTEDLSYSGVDRRADDIVKLPKVDLAAGDANGVSGLTGTGVGLLLDEIATVLSKRVQTVGAATNERHRLALLDARACLGKAKQGIQDCVGIEIAAEEIRAALAVLELLVGRISPEEVLGRVFASFCIGK